jgi:hypothetical protein
MKTLAVAAVRNAIRVTQDRVRDVLQSYDSE